ncbi:MAG: M36 family metallopeptidase, partial [Ilumatobacteraceae bacterium]
FSYRVWADPAGKHLPLDGPQGDAPSPHPTGTRNQYNPPFVPSTLLTLQNGPISTNDPWLPATAVDTRGNNAIAYADVAAPNGFSQGDLRATLTSPLSFDRVYDVAQSPNVSADQRMAAITQLFYNVNFFHDWYYDKGFDEKAGNAQADNYGRGGIANDAILAEAQDYSGKNNANMSTPSDGAKPVMQMYVFDGGAGAKLQRNIVGERALGLPKEPIV